MTNTAGLAGTLGIGDDGAFRIHFERTLPYPPARVWQWLTSTDKLEQWLPGCRIDARVGGDVLFDFGDEGHATGTVHEVVVPGAEGVLVHTWVWEGVPDSLVRWTIRPAATGSVLTLVHSEVSPEPATDFAIGWHVMLDALSLAADGKPTNDAWAGVETVAGYYS